jgi:hypothetical protein
MRNEEPKPLGFEVWGHETQGYAARQQARSLADYGSCLPAASLRSCSSHLDLVYLGFMCIRMCFASEESHLIFLSIRIMF